MALLQFDVVHLMDEATQVHFNSSDNFNTGLVAYFADVFKDKLGVLKGIKPTIAVEESALPRCHKPQPVPFALKDKVEQQLQKQVDEGEFVLVDSSDWAIPIAVVHEKDDGIRICKDFKVSINPVLQSQTNLLPTPEEIFSTLVIYQAWFG